MMQSIKRAKTLTVVGVMALLCLVGLKARAAVSVSDFIGDAEGGAPQCSVTVTNSGADVANPILILVRYEDGMLTDVKFDYPDSDLQSGGSAELAANLPAAPITDLTRITAFVLEDRQYAGIVESGLLEIERQGSANTGIDSIRFADIEAELATIDNEAKTIQLYLPLYDEVGEAIDTDELSLSVTVAEPAEQVQVGDTLLTGDEQVKEGVISLAQKSLTVISEDGTRDEYQLTIWRTLKENMEEGSRLNGYSMGKAGQAGMYVGDFAVNGTKASAIIKPSMNSASVGDTSYFAGIGLGVKPISDALPAVDAAPFPVGSSGADGNAMTLRKDTHKSGIGATGCGLLYLYGSQMKASIRPV